MGNELEFTLIWNFNRLNSNRKLADKKSWDWKMAPNIQDSFYCIPPKNTNPRKVLLGKVLLFGVCLDELFCGNLRLYYLANLWFILLHKLTSRMVCQLIIHSLSYFKEIGTEPRFNEVTEKLSNGYKTCNHLPTKAQRRFILLCFLNINKSYKKRRRPHSHTQPSQVMKAFGLLPYHTQTLYGFIVLKP